MTNLDRKPGFWLLVAALLPFMLAVEVGLLFRRRRGLP